MLTLTRRVGQTLLVGDAVEITVVEVSGGRVRLGVRAPREIAVHRGEVVARIVDANRESAVAGVGAGALRTGPRIELAAGLFGLGEHRAFALQDIEPGHPCHWLVSERDAAVRLLVTDATNVMPHYPVADACAAAGVDPADAVVAVVVNVPVDGDSTANLLAPLVWSARDGRGAQVVLDGHPLPVRHPIAA